MKRGRSQASPSGLTRRRDLCAPAQAHCFAYAATFLGWGILAEIRGSPHLIVFGQAERLVCTVQPPADGQRHLRRDTKPQCAFPHNPNTPSEILEIDDVLSISSDILIEFCCPELGVRSRGRTPPAAGMAMPKATMNQDNCLILGKHKIGLSWESGIVQPVAVASRVKGCADDHFRLGILTANAGHHLRASQLIHHVCHTKPSSMDHKG